MGVSDMGNSSAQILTFVALGNWFAASTAATTWWRIAAAGGVPAVLQGRFLVLASAALHFANLWLGRETQRPAHLSLCVALASLSVAWCCYQSRDDMVPAVDFVDMAIPPLAPWTTTIYVAFCVTAACTVWHV